MGRFLGHRIPDYNPFWEEKGYKDEPEYWKWYHLGHEDGYEDCRTYCGIKSEEINKITEENNALRNLLDARARLDKQLPDEEQYFIKEFMDKYDPKDKTPDEQV